MPNHPLQSAAAQSRQTSDTGKEQVSDDGENQPVEMSPHANLGQVLSKLRRANTVERLDTAMEAAVLNFWMCNHWTKDIFSDSSPVSYYSRRPTAMFFGNLVVENPYILDYLLTAPSEEVQAARVSIHKLGNHTLTGRLMQTANAPH